MPVATQIDTLLEEIRELKELIAKMNKYRFAEQYITNEELMQLLSISKTTTQQWRNARLIPFAQLGKKIYYRLTDIETLFDNNFKQPKHPKVKPRGLSRAHLAKRFHLKDQPNCDGWTIKV